MKSLEMKFNSYKNPPTESGDYLYPFHRKESGSKEFNLTLSFLSVEYFYENTSKISEWYNKVLNDWKETLKKCVDNNVDFENNLIKDCYNKISNLEAIPLEDLSKYSNMKILKGNMININILYLYNFYKHIQTIRNIIVNLKDMNFFKNVSSEYDEIDEKEYQYHGEITEVNLNDWLCFDGARGDKNKFSDGNLIYDTFTINYNAGSPSYARSYKSIYEKIENNLGDISNYLSGLIYSQLRARYDIYYINKYLEAFKEEVLINDINIEKDKVISKTIDYDSVRFNDNCIMPLDFNQKIYLKKIIFDNLKFSTGSSNSGISYNIYLYNGDNEEPFFIKEKNVIDARGETNWYFDKEEIDQISNIVNLKVNSDSFKNMSPVRGELDYEYYELKIKSFDD